MAAQKLQFNLEHSDRMERLHLHTCRQLVCMDFLVWPSEILGELHYAVSGKRS